MKRVFKYPLEVDTQRIIMPRGAKLLTVQTQGSAPMLWALVDDNAPMEDRAIIIVGTGWEVPEVQNLEYVGTFQVSGGLFVFHVFDQGSLK